MEQNNHIHMPQTNVRFKGQYVDMNSGFYSRTFSMDFMYRFGGYKRKEDKKGGRITMRVLIPQ